MKKSIYIHELSIDNSLFLFNTITYIYVILKDEDKLLWDNNEIKKISNYTELIKNYFIVENNEDMLNNIVTTLNGSIDKNPMHYIYITDECNQKCKYCFEKSIDNLSKINKSLSSDQINNIFGHIKKLNTKHDKSDNITLFGGEPLLEKNKAQIIYILSKIKSDKMSAVNIVTNGLTLGSYIDIIKEYESQIATIILTLNGFDKTHDQVRGSINNPTFYIIFENIKLLIKEAKKIKIRVNILIDSSNVDKIHELIQFFIDNKIDNDVEIIFGRIQFRVSDIADYKNELKYEDYYSTIIDNYYDNDIIKDSMITGSEVAIISKIYKQWKYNDIAVPEIKGCMAVTPGRYCYFVDGLIYPCTEVAGIKEYAIGNYMNETILNENKWLEYKINNNEKCMTCKYIGLCNMGCPATNISKNKNINDTYCLNIGESLDNFILSLWKKGFFYEKL